MMSEAFLRRRLVECCKLLYQRNLTVSAGGNMSVRLDDKHILITPSGANKGMLTDDDLVLMDMKGKVISGGKPSIEHRFHLGLYQANPEVNAIVHCHPLYCLAVATKGEPLKSTLTPEGVLLLDQVPTVRYETPGSEELVKAVLECSDAPAMLMAKHGAITQGRTLEEAFNRMEELEFQAHLQIILGNSAEPLPLEEVEKLREMR
ncbi:Ribulose-5-phosphate 4-epimerase-related epimerase and aldolase [Thermoplasmatales archaeon BRNA1]|nr:Ribulose-5-phosphate 4-epimerase-related epimerase and aldolase [Thermoplasmatales archaeon BRNA1]